jgi:hypothetical protein
MAKAGAYPTSGAGDAAQTTVFLLLPGAFFLSGVAALGVDATKSLLTSANAPGQTQR